MTLTIAHVDSFHKIPLESKRKLLDTLKHDSEGDWRIKHKFVEKLYFNNADAW